jgi:hypothetical protein
MGNQSRETAKARRRLVRINVAGRFVFPCALWTSSLLVVIKPACTNYQLILILFCLSRGVHIGVSSM